jgi:hypothetical protein
MVIRMTDNKMDKLKRKTKDNQHETQKTKDWAA